MVKEIYLIGGLEHVFFHFIYWEWKIIPTDELIFFKMIETTKQNNNDNVHCITCHRCSRIYLYLFVYLYKLRRFSFPRSPQKCRGLPATGHGGAITSRAVGRGSCSSPRKSGFKHKPRAFGPRGL